MHLCTKQELNGALAGDLGKLPEIQRLHFSEHDLLWDPPELAQLFTQAILADDFPKIIAFSVKDN